MKVVWSRLAVQDRDDQLDFVARDDVAAAVILGDAISAAAERLATFPQLGRVGRVVGTRELPVGRTRFLLVYRIAPGVVGIARLLHGAMRWPRG